MPVRVRPAEPGDETFILALNAACQPALGPLDAEAWRSLSGLAHRVLIAEGEAGEPVGFAVLVRPGAAYGSDNFAWFEERFGAHLYIDRVAVSAAHRASGAGGALYAAAIGEARTAGLPVLTAEVNESPPNPESLAFHACQGFAYLASRASRSGKIVAMLSRQVGAP